jgi:uncharacterized protein YcfL
MKYFFLLLLVVSMLFVSCGSSNEQATVDTNWMDTLKEIPADQILVAADSQKIGFKSGIVVYTSSTMGITQEVIFWFNNFGTKTRTEIKSEMLGQKVHQLSFVLDTLIYNIDMIAKEGTWNILKSDSSDNLNFRHITAADKEKYQIEELPKETILGKECKVIKMQQVSEGQSIDMTVWVWDGIPLKTVSRISGLEVLMEAKEVKVNLIFPDNVFEIPKGVTVIEEVVATDSIQS